MLRVWKPKSPMNLGTWMLSTFSGLEGLAFLQSAGADGRLGPLSRVAAGLPIRAAEAAGLPISLFMTTYTGVLLAGTSTPVWNQTPLLGSVFTCSSFASAVDAMQLEFALRDIDDPQVERRLHALGLIAKGAETGLILGHVARSRRAGRPLWSGLRGLQLLAGLALQFGATFLPIRKQLPPAPRIVERGGLQGEQKGERRNWRLIAALLGLAGAALIRWAFVHAGSDAADDVDAAHAATGPNESAPGWGQPAR
jgi:formate-dependent nitrite reductase membrane component NrfD